MKKFHFCLLMVLASLSSFSTFAQYSSLQEVQGKPAGIYTFNFGAGDFQAYVDADGWMLWLQYVRQGGTNPNLRVIQPGNNLPIYDASPLGTDLSKDPTKWGHGAQKFAASIPDADLWLRWEAVTNHHERKIHFESPVLGRFQSDAHDIFTPDIKSKHILRNDHTAFLPKAGNSTTGNVNGDIVLTNGPFFLFNKYSWNLRTSNLRWNVDDAKDDLGSDINYQFHTIHRVWVKPNAFNPDILMGALNKLQNHINGLITCTAPELEDIMSTLSIYANRLADTEQILQKSLDIISDFDLKKGPLFTTNNTKTNFFKDPVRSPGLELERVMVVLEQAIFDYAFTPEVYQKYSPILSGYKFKSCTAFPGDVNPPADPNITYTVPISANFSDPYGVNPSYDMNAEGTEHAFRPTGLYLAPGSVATVTVPASLIGKDYYIRVGAHEWDLISSNRYARLDRISKKFAINSTTIKIFNPFGGAIGIHVPYGAAEGIVNISVSNVVQAPFFSLKSFYTTADFNAELSKPAPWAVFETDNVMYTLPKYDIVTGKYDLKKSLNDWDAFIKAINYVSGRQITSDKHDLYMIADASARLGVNAVGYPMCNFPIYFLGGPTHTAWFLTGPNTGYSTPIHEFGHGYAISKFPGEAEATVNFLYVIGMNYGLGQDLNTAVADSFGDRTFDLNNAALDRIFARTWGAERDGSDSTKNEIRYQRRGYAHYCEIANLFGWCALRNFWIQEYLDLLEGNDHGINSQDTDDRILRLSVAAEADLRPLFEFYGIMVQNQANFDAAFNSLNLPPSLALYNRLNEFLNLIPLDNTAFAQFAAEVYPTYLTAGPTANPDYGSGYYYQKSLTYNEQEAQSRKAILQSIIDKYYPNGMPSVSNKEIVCFSETTLGANTEVNDVKLANDILVYPNPANDYINVSVLKKDIKNVNLSLYNFNGQSIKINTQNPGSGKWTIDLKGISSGIYLLKINADNDIVYKKIVVK